MYKTYISPRILRGKWAGRTRGDFHKDNTVGRIRALVASSSFAIAPEIVTPRTFNERHPRGRYVFKNYHRHSLTENSCCSLVFGRQNERDVRVASCTLATETKLNLTRFDVFNVLFKNLFFFFSKFVLRHHYRCPFDPTQALELFHSVSQNITSKAHLAPQISSVHWTVVRAWLLL